MPLPTLQCRLCGKSVPVLAAIQKAFCSEACRYRYNHNMPPEPATSFAAGSSETDTSEEIDDIGLVWQRAGMKYEQMTQQALNQEYYSTFKRSIIISGNGANMTVKHDCLVIKHGISYSPQEVIAEELNRGVHNVRRIVWSNASGNMSYAAIKWCSEQEIDLLVLDKDGKVLCESNPNRVADISTKRMQYTISRKREAEIARWIILGKVMGQYETYNRYQELQNLRTSDTFAQALSWLSAETTPARLDLITIRIYEARVASAYFAQWHDIQLHWHTSDKVPPHWRNVGDRNSPLSSAPTGVKAVRPAQAILNYAYGILAHTARAALLAVGLDISVGILHADKQYRDSLVYDLMEIGRGPVDALVLAFLKKTEFRKGDFTQVVTGEVRLHPELARAVIALCSISPDILLQHAGVLRNMIVAENEKVLSFPD